MDQDTENNLQTVLVQLLKNQGNQGLQNLHSEFHRVAPEMRMLKRFFSKKVMPEFQDDWQNPNNPLHMIRKDTRDLLQAWDRFQTEQVHLCREVITEEKLHQRSQQNSRFEELAIDKKVEINRWALQHNRVLPEALRIIGQHLSSSDSSIAASSSEAQQSIESLATESSAEAQQSIESLATESSAEAQESIESLATESSAEAKQLIESLATESSAEAEQATTKNWRVEIPVNFNFFVPKKLRQVIPASLRFQPNIYLKQNYIGLHLNTHLGNNINRGLIFRYNNNSLSFERIKKQNYITMSATSNLGSLPGTFSGHLRFPFTSKKTLFLENSKLFFQAKKNLSNTFVTSDFSINLATFSEKNLKKKQTKIENLPLSTGILDDNDWPSDDELNRAELDSIDSLATEENANNTDCLSTEQLNRAELDSIDSLATGENFVSIEKTLEENRTILIPEQETFTAAMSATTPYVGVASATTPYVGVASLVGLVLTGILYKIIYSIKKKD